MLTCETSKESPASAKKRDPAIDMARIYALICVPSIHFYLNNDYYSQNVAGIRMYTMTIHRTSLMICVPLFILLTGYLSSSKRLGKGCYKGLGRNLLIYILAGLACNVYRLLINFEGLTFSWVIFSLLGFYASLYGWYVNMYIGLGLMAPFLNAMYQALPTKKQKQCLLAVMLFLTALPSIFNFFDFLTEGWWASPGLSRNYQALIPNWWLSIYPLTYYFIGCYLREHPFKCKLRIPFFVYCLSTLLFGIYSIYRSDGGPYYSAAFLEWYSLPTVILTVSCFIFFMNIPTAGFPSWLKKCLAKLSDLCFSAYLLSWIFDSILYPRLNAAVPDMQLRMNWFLLIVPASIILSFTLSYILSLIQRQLELCIRVLQKYIRSKC